MKNDTMDKTFKPRTHEEMLAAVRAFQVRQRRWTAESDERLKHRNHHQETELAQAV